MTLLTVEVCATTAGVKVGVGATLVTIRDGFVSLATFTAVGSDEVSGFPQRQSKTGRPFREAKTISPFSKCLRMTNTDLFGRML
jgi:hypothetical protein